MQTPYSRAAVLLCLLAFAPAAWGQVQEEDDTEAVRSSEKEKSAGESEVVERPEVAASIVERTNKFRRQKERSAVETNSELTEAAAYFAAYMARTNRYGHTADGQRPSERAKDHGYSYCIVSENIAYQYSSAGFENARLVDRFMKGWKTSPGHRKNMLAEHVTETGVAVAQSKETGYIYAVQMFGRPKSDSIEFEVTNRSETTVEYQIGDRQFPLPPRYTRTHESCRPSKVTVSWQRGDEEHTRTVRPKDGDRFVIAAQEGQLKVERSGGSAPQSAPGR